MRTGVGESGRRSPASSRTPPRPWQIRVISLRRRQRPRRYSVESKPKRGGLCEFRAGSSCIWRLVPWVSPRRPASCGRTPIRRGRFGWCCRFRPAACSTSSAGRGPTRSARAGCSARSLWRISPAAAASVAHSAPDGYTIFLGTSSIHLAEMVLREHPLLDPMKDLVTISMVAITCFGIAVHPSVPAQNLKELVDYVKANPGKLSYGSAGAGTLNHLSGELLKSLAGITDLPHVPYRGAGPALADVIAGQIPIIIPAMTGQVLEFHRTGKLRLLAITNRTRLPVAPEMPTAAEAGVPGLVAEQVLALFAPGGTPVPIVAQIAKANSAAMADKAYQQSLIDQAVIPLTDWTTDKFNRFMDEDVARWTPLVKSIGIKLE